MDVLGVAATLAVEGAMGAVVAAMTEAGVETIVIKGPVQARSLYGEPTHASIDVDVLVPVGRVEEAEAVLAGLGYVATVETTGGREPDHAQGWVRQGSVPVDLHWSMSGADPESFWDALQSATTATALGRSTIRVPDAAGTSLIVALHAAQHGVGDERALDDLNRALQVFDSSVWSRGGELAVIAGVEGAFVAGLRLTPAGQSLVKRLGLTAQALSPEAALGLNTAPPTADGFLLLGSQPDWRHRVGLVWEKLLPSAGFMRQKYRVASRGRLGLVLAYLYRPLWLAWWAPRGFAAARRARRIDQDR